MTDNKVEVTTDSKEKLSFSGKRPAPTGKGSRQKRTDNFRLKKNDATDAVTTTGIFSRLKLADLTTVTELTIQRDHHPTIVPISFKRLHHLIDRTWDTMEAIGSRPFRAINTPGNRNIFEKGMLILSEAKVAFAQRAHIDKPDEDLPARKYYTSDELKDLNNMVTSLPLPLAIYLECIGNVKQGERIITPLLCQNENDVLSGAVSYAPRQLLPLLRILRTGVPRNGPIFQLAFQLEGLPGLVWEEFVPQDQPAPPDGDPIYVRLSPASADFWLDGPPQQENVRWTDAEYRIFQKIVRSLNFKKGFNVEVDLEHGNGTPAQFVQFADDWSVDASTRWLSMVEISDYDAKLGIVSRLEMLTDVTYLHDFEVPTPRQWTEAK